MRYVLIGRNNGNELTFAVNEKLEQGWLLYGQTFSRDRIFVRQAMVKLEPGERPAVAQPSSSIIGDLI